MDLQQLKTFVILAQYENMPSTADILGTSQSQISKSLSALENELGTRLFDRVGRGIRLNERGKIFLRYAESAIGNMTDGKEAIQNARNLSLGTVTIGTMAFGTILTPAVREYVKTHPRVSFRYLTPATGSRSDLRKIDILLSPYAHGQYNFRNYFPVSRIFLQEKYFIICSPRYGNFPKDMTSISYPDYRDHPFIVVGAPEPSMLINDYSVLDAVSNTLGARPPRIAFQANDFSIKMQLVGDGLGMSLLPDSCLSQARKLVPGLRVFSIEEFDISRTVIIARPRRNIMSQVSQEFWDFLLDSKKLEPDIAK